MGFCSASNAQTYDERKVMMKIAPEKDVDGFKSLNMG